MKRLMTLADTTFAHRLVWKLEEVGIRATLTTEHPPQGLYLGVRQAIIWIADDADAERAIEIHDQLLLERTCPECPRCGFDLRAHTGPTHCPECGRLLKADTADLPCPRCGESVPANFEVCWNCGEVLPGAADGK